MDKGLLGGTAPLLVLTLLKESDRYGGEIIKELEKRSENTFQFKEGTLYPILHKLEKKGYLSSYKSQGLRGKSRKYYSITEKGIKQLVDERTNWDVFSRAVQKTIGGQTHAVT